jgi:hypothetical protein
MDLGVTLRNTSFLFIYFLFFLESFRFIQVVLIQPSQIFHSDDVLTSYPSYNKWLNALLNKNEVDFSKKK